MTKDMLWHSPWFYGEKRLCFNTIRCAIAHGIARSSRLQTTTVYTIAASLEAPDFCARTRGKEGNSAESCA